MSSPPLDVDATLRDAIEAFQQGNLGLANCLCEMLLNAGQRHPMTLGILGMVSLQVREFKRAFELLREADALAPGDPALRARLDEARRLAREQSLMRPDNRRRYLIVKPWGYGFCSDLDHVLGCMLLSELTGRVPIIHWGQGSRFLDQGDDEAWSRLFAPVSKATLADVVGKGLSWFPAKWSDGNIREPEVNKFDGEGSRMAGPYFLNRREDIAVSDVHIPVTDLLGWIRPGSPYINRTLPEIYRMLVKKYIKPLPEITQRVEAFAAQNFAGRPMIAAHVRGSDKVVEDAKLDEKNRETPEIVRAFLHEHPTGRLFLLTDDAAIRAQYQSNFGDKVVTTECMRTTTAHGLHYIEQPSRRRLAVEVLVDMYLAARCDRFVGVGTSNVAAMIEHLKDWPEGSCTLLDHSIHYLLSPFLHRRVLPPELQRQVDAAMEAQRAREGG